MLGISIYRARCYLCEWKGKHSVISGPVMEILYPEP
ncbi:TPA: hypothetical protein SK272_004296 [Yersinia enterocolitica]|nr:hypothetical protein [Yersinia enterocolitica]